MQTTGSLHRPLLLALGVLLISGIAAVTMAHTAHFQPVTSAEVEGALSHLVQVAGRWRSGHWPGFTLSRTPASIGRSPTFFEPEPSL